MLCLTLHQMWLASCCSFMNICHSSIYKLPKEKSREELSRIFYNMIGIYVFPPIEMFLLGLINHDPVVKIQSLPYLIKLQQMYKYWEDAQLFPLSCDIGDKNMALGILNRIKYTMLEFSFKLVANEKKSSTKRFCQYILCHIACLERSMCLNASM